MGAGAVLVGPYRACRVPGPIADLRADHLTEQRGLLRSACVTFFLYDALLHSAVGVLRK